MPSKWVEKKTKKTLIAHCVLELFSFWSPSGVLSPNYSLGIVYLARRMLPLTWISCLLFLRPPERRHGYEQQFHSITSQSEHEALESKRPRMETVAESHISRSNPTAGGIVLPLTHAVQDSLRATVDVKKVGLVPLSLLLITKNSHWVSIMFLSSQRRTYTYYSCALFNYNIVCSTSTSTISLPS